MKKPVPTTAKNGMLYPIRTTHLYVSGTNVISTLGISAMRIMLSMGIHPRPSKKRSVVHNFEPIGARKGTYSMLISKMPTPPTAADR